MTREKFKDLIYKMQEYNELYDKLYDIGIDIINCKYTQYVDVFFDELMRSEFGDDGLDLVSWWMYEEVDHCIYEPYEGEDKKEFYMLGEEIPHGKLIADLNNIDDLYDYLVEGGRDGLNE